MGRRSSHPTTAPRIGESANAATVRETAPRTTGTADRPTSQPERGPACIRVADDERRSAVDPRFHLADRRVRKGSRVADDRHTVAGTEDALAVPALGVVADGERAERPPHLRLVDCLHRVREPADALGWGLVGRDPMSSSTPNAKSAAAGSTRTPTPSTTTRNGTPRLAGVDRDRASDLPLAAILRHVVRTTEALLVGERGGERFGIFFVIIRSPCAPDAISARPVTRTRRSPACSDRGSVAVGRRATRVEGALGRRGRGTRG